MRPKGGRVQCLWTTNSFDFTQHLVCSRRRFIPEYIRIFRGFKTSGKGNLAHILQRLNSQRSDIVERFGQVGVQVKAGAFPPWLMASLFTIWCVVWRCNMRCVRAGMGAQWLVLPSEKRWPSSWSGILSRPRWRQSLRGASGNWQHPVSVRVLKVLLGNNIFKKLKNTSLA